MRLLPSFNSITSPDFSLVRAILYLDQLNDHKNPFRRLMVQMDQACSIGTCSYFCANVHSRKRLFAQTSSGANDRSRKCLSRKRKISPFAQVESAQTTTSRFDGRFNPHSPIFESPIGGHSPIEHDRAIAQKSGRFRVSSQKRYECLPQSLFHRTCDV